MRLRKIRRGEGKETDANHYQATNLNMMVSTIVAVIEDGANSVVYDVKM